MSPIDFFIGDGDTQGMCVLCLNVSKSDVGARCGAWLLRRASGWQRASYRTGRPCRGGRRRRRIA